MEFAFTLCFRCWYKKSKHSISEIKSKIYANSFHIPSSNISFPMRFNSNFYHWLTSLSFDANSNEFIFKRTELGRQLYMLMKAVQTSLKIMRRRNLNQKDLNTLSCPAMIALVHFPTQSYTPMTQFGQSRLIFNIIRSILRVPSPRRYLYLGRMRGYKLVLESFPKTSSKFCPCQWTRGILSHFTLTFLSLCLCLADKYII